MQSRLAGFIRPLQAQFRICLLLSYMLFLLCTALFFFIILQ